MTASVRAQTAPIYKRYEREPLRAAHMPARVLALLKKPPSGGLGSGAGAAAAQGQAGKEGGGEAEKDKRKEEEAEYHAARRRAKRTREQEWDYVRKTCGAGPNDKLFVLGGRDGAVSFPGMREALLERGWVEHTELESPAFDLKWCLKTSEIDFNRLHTGQIVNHFASNRHVTTKVGLARSLRSLKWFQEVDAESFFPRSYDLNDHEEVCAFVEDYCVVQAMGVLKRFLSDGDAMEGPRGEPIRCRGGYRRLVGLSMRVCEGYHSKCTVADLDDAEEGGMILTASEWTLVLGEECPVATAWLVKGADADSATRVGNKAASLGNLLKNLGRRGAADLDDEEDSVGSEEEITQERAKRAIEAVDGLSPQSSINGLANAWIVKPAGKSRGRGIQVLRSLLEILSHVTDSRSHAQAERWVVQKYVEDPFLIDGRKFDLRQWVLATDLNPLTVWIYNQPYLRFAMAKFDLEDTGNRFAHLCNNCVQREDEGFALEGGTESMWTLAQLVKHLEGQGKGDLWEKKILPAMRRVSIWALMSAQDLLVSRKGTAELYGYDFLVDSSGNVWLLEVNSSPDMAATTEVTKELCGACLRDVVKVVVDCDGGAGEGDTGGWELIHKGEAEVSAPVSVTAGLKVVGRRARITKPSLKEVYDKLGMQGSERKGSFKVTGSKRVFETRAEMLHALNTTGIVPPPPLYNTSRPASSKSRPCTAPRQAAAPKDPIPGVESFVARLNEWKKKREEKVSAIALERDALLVGEVRRSASSSSKTGAGVGGSREFMSRMLSDAAKRKERKAEFDEKIVEAMSGLDWRKPGTAGGRRKKASARRTKRGTSKSSSVSSDSISEDD